MSEWYEDETKHEYLKKLWLFYPSMIKLNNLNDQELGKKLEKIGYSKWEQKDKEDFKKCIKDSPENAAMEFQTFFKQNYNEFNMLIENSVQYNKFLEKYDLKDYECTCYNIIKNLIKIVKNIYDIDKEVIN